MLRPTPLVAGEAYHVYNRGAHKQKIFTTDWDYQRFMLLLLLSNHSEPVHLSNLLVNKKYQGESLINIFKDSLADKSLVDILAYCLMPNHFHLVLRQKAEDGISIFMRKLLTAYTMYFNTKYEHSGVIFQGPFKSRHIDNEAYFRYIFAYVHLNALDLFEAGWKKDGVQDVEKARVFMHEYSYSSLADCLGQQRPERAILSFDSLPDFLREQNDLEDFLTAFYRGESLVEGVGKPVKTEVDL